MCPDSKVINLTLQNFRRINFISEVIFTLLNVIPLNGYGSAFNGRLSNVLSEIYRRIRGEVIREAVTLGLKYLFRR